MTPFDSTNFFNDPFFLQDTVILQGGLPVQGILIDDLDPEKHGNLATRPGHWARLYLLTSIVPDVFPPGYEMAIKGQTWRKDSSTDQGDVTEILVWTEQRKR